MFFFVFAFCLMTVLMTVWLMYSYFLATLVTMQAYLNMWPVWIAYIYINKQQKFYSQVTTQRDNKIRHFEKTFQARFIRRISVVSNAIQTIDNEITQLIHTSIKSS